MTAPATPRSRSEDEQVGSTDYSRPRKVIATVVVLALVAGATAVSRARDSPGEERSDRVLVARRQDDPLPFRSVPGREQHGKLYTVNADGSGLKQLTHYPAPKAVFAGSFSPDGKWITDVARPTCLHRRRSVRLVCAAQAEKALLLAAQRMPEGWTPLSSQCRRISPSFHLGRRFPS